MAETNVTTGPEPTEKSPLKRAIYASLGVLFVGIAAAGVFLPGIPTAGPLILASLFLTKSSPTLERKLIRNRFFSKYLQYLDGQAEMPPHAKRTAIGLMWLSITISCTLLYLSGKGPWWMLSIIVLAGVVGTIFIWRYGKGKGEPKSF